MAVTRAGSKQLLRDLNQSAVLNLIAKQGAISRIDVARQSGLQAATVTRIVNEFVEANLLTEAPSEEASTGSGRRPVLLSINPAAGYVVGVKLREEDMLVALCDLSCTVIHSCEGTLGEDTSPYKVVERIAEAVRQCINDAHIPPYRVLGVGVGLAGLIDFARGLCRYSPMLQWRDVELAPALAFHLRLPVRIDNDVNTLAVAERQFGAGRDVSDFLLITVGRGVGVGVVLKGEVYRGGRGGAGEFGHTTMDFSPDAPLCNCGKHGCLEAIASNYGLLRTIQGNQEELLTKDTDVKDTLFSYIDRARAGDEHLRQLFTHAGCMLGVALANQINMLDPIRVFVEDMPAGTLMLEPMRQTIPLHTFGSVEKDLIQIVEPASELHWARGAASLILQEVFQPPIYESQQAIVIDDLLTPARDKRSRKR